VFPHQDFVTFPLSLKVQSFLTSPVNGSMAQCQAAHPDSVAVFKRPISSPSHKEEDGLAGQVDPTSSRHLRAGRPFERDAH